jgi:hypothetical protein
LRLVDETKKPTPIRAGLLILKSVNAGSSTACLSARATFGVIGSHDLRVARDMAHLNRGEGEYSQHRQHHSN